MNSFDRDFSKELEACVSKGTANLAVVNSWSPGKSAPPEIHLLRAKEIQVPLEAVNYQLRRSTIYNMIGDFLGMYLSEQLLNGLTNAVIDPEKVQVWLFARVWLNNYSEYLCDPLTQRSVFYKERHDEFLSLLRHMLEFQVNRRLTFKAALASWFPESDLLKEDQTADDDGSDDDNSHHATAPVAVGATFSPSLAVAPTVARRLVLKGLGGPAERSKTRKNRCN